MKVLIDGKEVECLNDVKIIHENQLIDVKPSGKEVYGNLEITLTSEGMIADVWRRKKVEKTMWKELEDIMEETH